MALFELVEEKETQPNRSLLELQERAREMAKYCDLGLADALQLLILEAERYSREDSQGKRLFEKELKKSAYGTFQKIQDFYAEIPDSLQGREFHPLSVIRELLPELHKSLDNVFDGKIGYEHDFGRIAITIAGVQPVSYTHLTLPTTPYV